MNRFAFFIIFLLSTSLYSIEFAALPAEIQGEIPARIRNIPNADWEFQRLSVFYALESFRMQAVSEEKIRETWNSLEYDAKPKGFMPNWKELCHNLHTDYISKDQIYFFRKLRIRRNLFNCNLRKLYEKELLTDGDIFASFQSITADSFPFVPRRNTQKYSESKRNVPQDHYIFAIDISPSFAAEVAEIRKFLSSQNWPDRSRFRLVLFGSSGSKIYPEEDSTAFQRRISQDISLSGKSRTNDLTSMVLRLLPIVSRSRVKPSIWIFTNSRSDASREKYVSAMYKLRNYVSGLTVLVGGALSAEDYANHQKAVRAAGGNLLPITYVQNVALADQNASLVLKRDELFWQEGMISTLAELDTGRMEKLHTYSLGAKLQPVSPFNMKDAFTSLTGQKVVSSSKVTTNLENTLSDSLKLQNMSPIASGSFHKFLIQSGSTAFWIYLPESFSRRYRLEAGSILTVATTFVPERSQTEGVQNIPDSTDIFDSPIPHFLRCTPIDAKNYLENTGKTSFRCVVTGKITRIRPSYE